MKKVSLLICLAFVLGCLFYQPSVMAKEKSKAPVSADLPVIGDKAKINLGKNAQGQPIILDVVLVDILVTKSAATGEDTMSYRFKEEKYYTVPGNDPRITWSKKGDK